MHCSGPFGSGISSHSILGNFLILFLSCCFPSLCLISINWITRIEPFVFLTSFSPPCCFLVFLFDLLGDLLNCVFLPITSVNIYCYPILISVVLSHCPNPPFLRNLFLFCGCTIFSYPRLRVSIIHLFDIFFFSFCWLYFFKFFIHVCFCLQHYIRSFSNA